MTTDWDCQGGDTLEFFRLKVVMTKRVAKKKTAQWGPSGPYRWIHLLWSKSPKRSRELRRVGHVVYTHLRRQDLDLESPDLAISEYISH